MDSFCFAVFALSSSLLAWFINEGTESCLRDVSRSPQLIQFRKSVGFGNSILMPAETINCPGCDKAMASVYQFCLLCGTELKGGKAAKNSMVDSLDFPTVSTKHSSPFSVVLVIFAGAILTAGLIAGTYYLTRPADIDRQSEEGERSPASNGTEGDSQKPPVPSKNPVISPGDATPTPADITRNPPSSGIPDDAVVILDRQIHIAPKSYFAQEFEVANSARLHGTFDSTSPIELAFMTDKGSEVYHSARINKGSVDLRLAPGKYYVILENRFSWITSKDVQTVIYIQYH
jgi:hypothetical protein